MDGISSALAPVSDAGPWPDKKCDFGPVGVLASKPAAIPYSAKYLTNNLKTGNPPFEGYGQLVDF
ncbi:hypothetical protein C4J81_19075 (plasmid) [Deltaproteobacteria bacterium Smac51]|nr:hypothetical protein C4J81_19075 [Deltaproteobacteria bacterium Smac51]